MVIMTSGKGKENGLISTFVPRIEEDFPNTPGGTEFLGSFFFFFFRLKDKEELCLLDFHYYHCRPFSVLFLRIIVLLCASGVLPNK